MPIMRIITRWCPLRSPSIAAAAEMSRGNHAAVRNMRPNWESTGELLSVRGRTSGMPPTVQRSEGASLPSSTCAAAASSPSLSASARPSSSISSETASSRAARYPRALEALWCTVMVSSAASSGSGSVSRVTRKSTCAPDSKSHSAAPRTVLWPTTSTPCSRPASSANRCMMSLALPESGV